MQEIQNSYPAQNEFGLTQEEYKSQRIKNVLLTIKLFLQKIEPYFVKAFNVTFYYSLKFIKSFVGYAFQMIKGGGS